MTAVVGVGNRPHALAAVQAELARLRAENARLRTRQASPLRVKVSAKGALSVDGLGRFPVPLYQEQWARLLDAVDASRAFLTDHDGELKGKEHATGAVDATEGPAGHG